MLDLTETKRRVEASSRVVVTMSAKLRDAYEEIERQRQDLADMKRRNADLESLLNQLLDAVESQKAQFVPEEDRGVALDTLSEALVDVSESSEDGDWSDLDSDEADERDKLPRFKRILTSS
jgi:hypothetical protein